MKFSEMPYTRPDVEQVKEDFQSLNQDLKGAKNYEEANAVFLRRESLMKHLTTQRNLAHIRHTIDTRDPFYNEETLFFNQAMPLLEPYEQEWNQILLSSPFRSDFEREYGNVMFLNKEIALKTFSPEIIPDLRRENDLKHEYEKLLASAQIPFEGNVYTISQITPYKNDPDDERRLAAWKAEGQWYKDNQSEMDRLFDELVKVRDAMGRKLGYDGFTELGYYRMKRNCYTKEDVERFRGAVRDYLVPVADDLKKAQAKRLGLSYPLTFSDNQLEFRSGNPKPIGTPDEILAQGRKFYRELSEETGTFFSTMLDMELLDVRSTKGKASGGYCTDLPDYAVPFIFANFNGTQHDVEVVTHEAGHAFADWMNRDRIPSSSIWPTMEACEVHSMSMEFFSWPWAEGFFGADAGKFYYAHLANALTFIPYGTMVDHFQHEVYAHPDYTPRQRHDIWKNLLGIYMPWLKLDGDIPFYAEGEGWQRQHHIYSSPFYYIDYCLAQTVALQFWALIQKDPVDAWNHYMAYTKQGGSKVFTELLKNADLASPLDPDCLRSVSATAKEWLEHYDLSGIL